MGKSKVKPVEEKVTAPAKPEAIEEPQKTVQKQGKAKVRSQKYQQALGKVDRNISYPLSEALDLVKNSSYCQFPATVELHLNTRIKGLRGLLTLPYSSGKKLNILVFAPAGAKLESKEVTLGDLKGQSQLWCDSCSPLLDAKTSYLCQSFRASGNNAQS